MSKEVLIELKDISKSYGKKHVLWNVNAKIYKGDRIGIAGPNGAGKSTISEIITKIKTPTSGELVYTDPKTKLGIQFQDSNYPESVKVKDIIIYYADTYNLDLKEENLSKLISYFDLDEFYNRLINSLSGGQKQRLNILLSIMHDPDMVLLDELTTGLDIEAKDRMRDIINEKILTDVSKTLLIVSHSMSEIEEVCNRLWFVAKGGILKDVSVKETIKVHGSIDKFIRKEMHVLREEMENESTE